MIVFVNSSLFSKDTILVDVIWREWGAASARLELEPEREVKWTRNEGGRCSEFSFFANLNLGFQYK